MIDYKKFAMVLGVMILLPLFLGLFFDAIYEEPEYSDFCNDAYNYPGKAIPAGTNCQNVYDTAQARQCSMDRGIVRVTYDNNSCEVFEKCDYCQKEFDDARSRYNRNLFFILAPIGLVIVILGIYISVDYIGAGLMFGGLITLFYATIRYFSDMDKLMRALVILIELLIIIWIGYLKIGHRPDEAERPVSKKTDVKQKKR